MAKPAEVDVEGDSHKFGDPSQFDPTFKGPIKNRSCTDILCLFFFVAFLAGWAVVAVFAYKLGNPETLLHPTDSEGNICGEGKFVDAPYLFFFDLTQCAQPGVILKGCNTPQVCVKNCPDDTFLASRDRNWDTKFEKLICRNGVTKAKEKMQHDIEKGNCADYYLTSSPLAGRCLPTKLGNLTADFGKDSNLTPDNLTASLKKLAAFLNVRDLSVRMFQDFSAAWWMMIIFLLFSMVVSFIWILMMRWIAGTMVVLSIILVLAILGFASGFSFYTYNQLDKGDVKIDAFQFEFVRDLDTFTSSKRTWLISGIIFGITWLILVLVLIFLRKRVKLAIALIREGSKAVGSSTSSLFFPLLPYVLQLLVFVFWGSVAIYIASSGKKTAHWENVDGTPTGEAEPCNMETDVNTAIRVCMFSKYEGEGNLFRAQIYNLFALFWSMFFVVGLGQISLAGAFASYYWAFNKPQDVPYFAVAGGMWRGIRYHMGSVAFGSLLISLVRMIRVVLEYIDQQCKKYSNPFTKVVLCCCKCCFWCLEKFMRFLSKNAYIMIAVYGKNFCTSAKESFMLLMRNVVRVVVLDKVTDYLLLLGKLVVVGITAVAAFFFFSGKVKYINHYSPELNYYFLPVITVTIGAYLIATGFFNVYSMAVDTLFLCFLEDCERNDGSPERPYYMSRELMKILGKKNKFRELN